jgi:hypothetical protein
MLGVFAKLRMQTPSEPTSRYHGHRHMLVCQHAQIHPDQIGVRLGDIPTPSQAACVVAGG